MVIKENYNTANKLGVKQCRSSWLSVHSAKKRTISIDDTVLTTISELGPSQFEKSRMQSQQSAYSRAVSQLARYPAHRDHHIALVSEKCNFSSHSADDTARVEDIFCMILNKCEPESLPELRLKRAEIAPIVCYESEDEGDEDEKQAESSDDADFAISSRLEALRVQQRLLGDDHPDVDLLTQQIELLQSRRGRLRTNSFGQTLALNPDALPI